MAALNCLAAWAHRQKGPWKIFHLCLGEVVYQTWLRAIHFSRTRVKRYDVEEGRLMKTWPGRYLAGLASAPVAA